MRHQVVITGMGVLAANGIGLDAFWRTLLAGESGVATITRFDPAPFPVRIAGEVKDFDEAVFLPGVPHTDRMARHTHLALAAAFEAIRDAGLDAKRLREHEPVPLAMGVATSAIDVIERTYRQVTGPDARRVHPAALAASMPNIVTASLIDVLGLHAHFTTISTGCAAGLDAIAHVARRIAEGEAYLGIAGGADAPLNPLAFASFCRSNLLSRRNDDPGGAGRPFDAGRDGGVLAEGAGVVVLERREHALARGARAYARVAGYGTSGDVDDDHGSGLADSMRQALNDAGFHAGSVDWVNAHGPGDPDLDAAEVRAVKAVFGARAHAIPVGSIKGVTGNPLSAAGPMTAIATALGLRAQCVPPTANWTTPDPDCDLDVVPGRARRMTVGRALANVHGLGRVSSTLALERIG